MCILFFCARISLLIVCASFAWNKVFSSGWIRKREGAHGAQQKRSHSNLESAAGKGCDVDCSRLNDACFGNIYIFPSSFSLCCRRASRRMCFACNTVKKQISSIMKRLRFNHSTQQAREWGVWNSFLVVCRRHRLQGCDDVFHQRGDENNARMWIFIQISCTHVIKISFRTLDGKCLGFCDVEVLENFSILAEVWCFLCVEQQ